MRIIKLKDCNEEIYADLAQVDQYASKKYSSSFSDERWGVLHFKHPLPSKFEMSLVALNSDNKVCGYCIASLKNGAYPYIHRFVGVNSEQPGITNHLIEAFTTKYTNIYLLVAKNNPFGVKFYEEHGFSIVSKNDDLEAILPKLYPNILAPQTLIQDKYLMKKN